jgi:hypothetical protein
MATRASSRIPKDGRTVLEKATQHVQQKNDTSKGIHISNQFLILNNLENDYICDVASTLDLNIENVDTQLEVFKAEERVRAALAEANYKEYSASVNKRTSPQDEEEIQEYNLEAFDNLARDAEGMPKQLILKTPQKGGET